MSASQDRSRLGRRGARLAAVQALYQMELSGRGVADVTEEFVHHRFSAPTEASDLLEAEAPLETDEAFFRDILKGVVERQGNIDRSVNETLNESWRMDRLDSLLRALMRAATFELIARSDVPPKVVITEYVDVGHAFLDAENVRFVNGALDTLARRLRGDGEGLRERPAGD